MVIIGLGWTGSIMANELTDEGLDGRCYRTWPVARRPRRTFRLRICRTSCDIAFATRLFLQPEQTTFTFRKNGIMTRHSHPTAAPSCRPMAWEGVVCTGTRKHGGFCLPDFVLKSHLTQRYGAALPPKDNAIQDWGVTYDDLEPHYDRFEYLCGTSGTAGNIGGRSKKVAIRSKDRDRAPIPIRHRHSRLVTRCLRKRRVT